MNKCEQYCRTIQRLCNIASEGGGYSKYIADAWQDITSTISYNQGKTYTETVSQIAYTFQNGVPGYSSLTPNGVIYIIPAYDSQIYKLNTNNDTITTIASVSGDRKWNSPIYHAETNCIYACPNKHSSIFKLDVSTDNVTYIGDFGNNDYKFKGSSIAPNGYVYFFPSLNAGGTNGGNIIKLNPYDDTYEYISTGISTSTGKTASVVLSPDGTLYSAQESYNKIIKLDSSDDSVTLLDGMSVNSNGYTGGLYMNGLIYYSGRNSPLVSYNISTGAFKYYSASNGYGGVTLGANGVAYSASMSNASGIARIDTVSDARLTWLSASTGYGSPILAPNGSIYAVAFGAAGSGIQKITINIEGGRNFKESTLLSPFLNKV